MAKSPFKFTCACCGATKHVNALSKDSLETAGTSDPKTALDRLEADDLVCQECADWEEEVYERDAQDTDTLGLFSGRTDSERFNLAGLRLDLDPGRRSAYLLNY